MSGDSDQTQACADSQPQAATETTIGVSLVGLFADGPFARLENFEEDLVRERTSVREVPIFKPEGG